MRICEVFWVEPSECNGICFKTGILKHTQALPHSNLTFCYEVPNAWAFQFLSRFKLYTTNQCSIMQQNGFCTKEVQVTQLERKRLCLIEIMLCRLLYDIRRRNICRFDSETPPSFLVTFNAQSEQYFQTFVMCDTNTVSLFSWSVYPFSHPFPCSRAPLQSPCRCPDTSPWDQKTHRLSYCHPHFLSI